MAITHSLPLSRWYHEVGATGVRKLFSDTKFSVMFFFFYCNLCEKFTSDDQLKVLFVKDKHDVT